jgi:hypothetical protein
MTSAGDMVAVRWRTSLTRAPTHEGDARHTGKYEMGGSATGGHIGRQSRTDRCFVWLVAQHES